jgi:hypothetical protein
VPSVLVANGGSVGAGVVVGVSDGSASAVKVIADENVPTALVWISLTLCVGVTVPSASPAPHEAISKVPKISSVRTLINRFLSIYSPFQTSRYFNCDLPHH